MIPQMGDDNQIIATTHSPYLDDAVRPDAVIDPGQGTIRMTVFNHLGSQGWELATHTMALIGDGTNTRRTEIWTFKRPMP